MKIHNFLRVFFYKLCYTKSVKECKYKLRTKTKILLSICLFFLLPIPIFAQSSQTSVPNTKIIRVGWAEIPGYIDTEAFEKPSGYVKKYLDRIAQYTDWEYIFIKGSFQENFKALYEGRIDILPCLEYTDKCSQKIQYPQMEMAYAYSSLFVRKDSILDDKQLSSLNGISIGALNNADENFKNLKLFAQENKLQFNFQFFNSLDEIEAAVLNRIVDAGIVSLYQEKPLTKTILQFAPKNLYLGCTNSDDSIIEGINYAQSQFFIANQNFVKDFMKLHSTNNYRSEFSLTRQEQDNIRKTAPLTVAINNVWQPYEFYDERSKKFYGFTIDLFNEVSKLTGLQFQFVNERKNKDSKADIFGTYGNNIEFANSIGYKITEPYLKLPLAIVYKDSFDLQDGLTSIIEGSTFAYHDFKIFDKWNPVNFKDQEACLNAIRQGLVNQTVMNTFTASYEIHNKKKYAQLKIEIIPDTNFELSALVRKDIDPIIFSILNKSLQYVANNYSNYLIIQSTYKTNQITISSIINKMPHDVVLAFLLLFSIMTIAILIGWFKSAQRSLELNKNIQLEDALLSEQRANQAKTQFTSRISHEIRSPLNAVIGYITIAKTQDCEKDKIIEYLAKAEFAAKQLLVLLNNVLDMSSIASGKILIAEAPFSIKEVVSTLSTLFYNQAKMSNIKLIVLIEALEHEILLGDHIRLTQILTNLLSNAIKFTPKGGIVTFTILEEKYNAEKTIFSFKIKDTGIGMPEEFIDKIFNPYEQAEHKTQPMLSGSGLGLSITKNLVNLLNGAISVSSKEGFGSTFTVTIPFGFERKIAKPFNGSYNHLRFLIISDNQKSIKQLQAMFILNEFLNVETLSFKELENEITNIKTVFDLILYETDDFNILDVEKLKAIHEKENFRNSKIAAIAYDFNEITTKNSNTQVDVFLLKPVFQSTLFNTLVDLFGPYKPSVTNKALDCSFEGKKILLVEDNEINIEIAREFLKKYKVEIEIAKNGKEAYDLFMSSPESIFDLILMDIQMPLMNGYEATKKIRASIHPHAKDVPIVAMTANAFVEDISLSLASGMNDHLSKPIDINELIAVLTKYLQ